MRLLRIVLQVVFVVAVAALLGYIYDNLVANLRRAGIRTDFGFLDQPAGFEIAGSSFRSTERVRNALVVGLLNTAALAGVGVILTTVLGVVVGVARLSSNWLVRRTATLYVETLRNIPPLLVIVFMFTAVILQLPTIQQATDLGIAVVSNRDLAVAAPEFGQGSGAFLGLSAVGVVLAVMVAVWRTRQEDTTGKPHHRVAWGAAVFLALTVGGWMALGRPVGLSRPEVVGLGVEGGITLKAAYVAMLVALVLYTASHVAEIVRGSIQAVPRGQTEAATALALSDFQRLRFVILPQAARIALPPLINQYLNFVKNTSLAVAIGFPEVTSMAIIVISNGSPAPQVIGLVMLFYLLLSLVISGLSNLVNRRLRLAER